MNRALARLVLPVSALLLAACSSHGNTASHAPMAASRTVEVTMVDNSFQPSTLQVSKGETVTFRFTNTGAVRHEATIGDAAVQDHHREEMTAATGANAPTTDGHHGDDATTVTVEPGSSASLTHAFADDTVVVIGCHEPGHWEAGMKATVTVA